MKIVLILASEFRFFFTYATKQKDYLTSITFVYLQLVKKPVTHFVLPFSKTFCNLCTDYYIGIKSSVGTFQINLPKE